MEEIINLKNKNKNKMQKFPQSKYIEMSKSSNITINSFINKKNDYSKDSTDMISREFLNSIKINPKSTKNKIDTIKIRKTLKPAFKTQNSKKIYIKIQQIEDLPIYNNTVKNIRNNSRIEKNIISSKTTLKNMNKKNNNKRIRLKCLSSKKKKICSRYNYKTTALLKKNEKSKEYIKDIRNKSENRTINSEVLDISFGDSSIEINKPKKSEIQAFFINPPPGRKSTIPFPTKKCSHGKIKDIEENNNDYRNEIKNKKFIHNIIEYNCQKKNAKSKTFIDKSKDKNDVEATKKISFINNQFHEKDHELDSYFKNYNSNNNINNNNYELFRFSNISSYNNNDLFYINNKNKYDSNNPINSKNNIHSIVINPKIEKIEEDESHILNDFLIDDNFENEIMINDKNELKNINNDLASIPCMNCGKMVNVDEIDRHSNNCFKMKEEIKTQDSNNNYISNIDNKLKKIYEYLNNIEKGKININNELNEYLDFISMMKKYIEKIMSIKIINSLAIEELSEINNIFNKLMEKYFNSKNIFALISRIKVLLEEKKKLFMAKNITKIEIISKIKAKNTNVITWNANNKNIRKTMVSPSCDQLGLLCEENSIEQAMSENETMEFFDLKRILNDKKEKKEYNLDNLVNEAKNKRLFLMEVLKVKYQKINNNNNENKIPPIMIWKEAMKNNIKMNNWSKFIFDELNNPNKYLRMLENKKDNKCK